MSKQRLLFGIIASVMCFFIIAVSMFLFRDEKAGTTPQEQQTVVDGPLSYSLGNLPVSVTTMTRPFSYTAGMLQSMGEGCGTLFAPSTYEEIVAEFAGTEELIYTFTYTEPHQGGDYVMTVLPNKIGYLSLDAFKDDFNVCDAGADRYPFAVSEDWLVFHNGCGTGYDDGAKKPHSCQLVKDAVITSLEIE